MGYTHFERYWNCSTCNRQNLGRFTHCGGCGRPQPHGVKFYGKVPLDDPQLIALAQAGPNKACNYCGANSRNGSNCGNCGADLSEAAPSAQTRKGNSDLSRRPVRVESDWSRSNTGSRVAASAIPWTSFPSPQGSRLRTLGIGAAIAVGVIIVATFIYLMVRTHDVPAQIVGFAWERTVSIDRRGTETGKDWEDEVPSDATKTGCRSEKFADATKEQTGTKKVKVDCPDEDLDNGFGRTGTDCFKEEPTYSPVPAVYKDFCSWERQVWLHDRDASAYGADQNPKWPDYYIGYEERESDRRQNYRVTFRATDGTDYRYDFPDPTQWQQMTAGTRYILKVNTFGMVMSFEEQANSF